MQREFAAIVETDGEGDGFSARCLELPGAAGRGHTPDEAMRRLAERLACLLQERRAEALPAPGSGGVRARVASH